MQERVVAKNGEIGLLPGGGSLIRNLLRVLCLCVLAGLACNGV